MLNMILLVLILSNHLLLAQTVDPGPDDYSPSKDATSCPEQPHFYKPIVFLSLADMIKLSEEMSKTDWQHGTINVNDLLRPPYQWHSSSLDVLCRVNSPKPIVKSDEPSVAKRVLAGIAEKSIGESIEGTISGGPTIFFGYKHVPQGQMTTEKIGSFLAPKDPLLSPEAMLLTTKQSLMIEFMQKMPYDIQTRFGTVRNIKLEYTRNGLTLTEIEFTNISFKKETDKSGLVGFDSEGKRFTIFCPVQL